MGRFRVKAESVAQGKSNGNFSRLPSFPRYLPRLSCRRFRLEAPPQERRYKNIAVHAVRAGRSGTLSWIGRRKSAKISKTINVRPSSTAATRKLKHRVAETSLLRTLSFLDFRNALNVIPQIIMRRFLHITYRLPSRLAIMMVREMWQKRIGPRYNRRFSVLCRFYPSCSAYAVLALEKHGLLRGAPQAFNRVRRCNARNCESTIDYP